MMKFLNLQKQKNQNKKNDGKICNNRISFSEVYKI